MLLFQVLLDKCAILVEMGNACMSSADILQPASGVGDAPTSGKKLPMGSWCLVESQRGILPNDIERRQGEITHENPPTSLPADP